jgi:hypothetical protein
MEKHLLILNGMILFISLVLFFIAIKKESRLWMKAKFYIVELIAMASNKPSYFSLKRCHQIWSMYLFFAAWAKILHMMVVNDILTPQAFNINNYLVWAAPLLAIGGYYNSITQKEKGIENKNQNIADTEVK